MLLNSSGRPMAASRRSSPTQTLGTGGTAIYSGWVSSREQNPLLFGRRRYVTFAETLANVSIVAAGARGFLNLISKPSWSFTPPEVGHNRKAEAKELADLMGGIIEDMRTPWHRVVRRQALYRFYGFAVQEWTAKRRSDGRLGLLDIEARPQFTIERWDVSEVGTEVNGVIQRSPQTHREIYIPRNRLMYSVDDTLNDSPEGLGLLRHLVEPTARLNEMLALEQIGFQTDLRGIPIASIPLTELIHQRNNGDITEKDFNDLVTPYSDFIRNHMRNRHSGMILDSSTYPDIEGNPGSTRKWMLDLLQGPSTGRPEIAAAIQRINEEMARIMGVEHMLLGSSDAGSYALSSDKTNSFAMMIESVLRDLRDTVAQDIVDRVWSINGFDDEVKPKATTENVQVKDVAEVVTTLRDLATAGASVMPDDPAIPEIYGQLGLPAPEREGDEDDEDGTL